MCWSGVYPSGTLLGMKDVGLRIRIDRELRERFVAACKEGHKPAAQVLREFMRHYVESHARRASPTPVPGTLEIYKAEQ